MPTLNVRMTEEEYKKIEEDAKKHNMSISAYIKLITQKVKIEVKLNGNK